jgi:hypothetical protein
MYKGVDRRPTAGKRKRIKQKAVSYIMKDNGLEMRGEGAHNDCTSRAEIFCIGLSIRCQEIRGPCFDFNGLRETAR